jgi:hypothetical protein
MSSWRCRIISVAATAVALAAPLHAQTLYYGGDVNPNLSFTSGVNLLLAHAPNQLVFDNFVVGGLPWQVTSVFANLNVSVSPFPSTLSWEIRSGMARGQTSGGTPIPGGSVGTVVQSGSGAYSVNSTTYTIPVTPFALGPGTYWLSIYSDLANATSGLTSASYITSGVNSINAPGDQMAIWLVGVTGPTNAGGIPELISGHDISYGVNGTVLRGTTTPEPATWTLLIAGLAAIGATARRRES